MPPERPFRHVGEVVLERFLIDRALGEGAFAWVYHGRNKAGTEVAVKIPRDSGEDAILRLAREARVLRALPSSPYFVRFVAEGKTRHGAPLIVLEYIDGITLSEGMQSRGPLSPPRAVAFAAALCQSVWGLHRLGVAHRHIEPANVLMTRAGEGELELVDFGIVHDPRGTLKLPEEADGPKRLAPVFGLDPARGAVAEALCYMAPEQLSGPLGLTVGWADTASDVFSLGLILYELLSGTNPVKGSPDAGLREYVDWRLGLTDDDLPPVPKADAALWAIVTRALASDPRRRPPHANALRGDLIQYLASGLEPAARRAFPALASGTPAGGAEGSSGSTATDLDLHALATQEDGADALTDVSPGSDLIADAEARVGRATAVFLGVGDVVTSPQRPWPGEEPSTHGRETAPAVRHAGRGAADPEAAPADAPAAQDDGDTSTWTPPRGSGNG